MRTKESYIACGKKGAQIRWSKAPPFAERFWSKVKRKSPNACWLWLSSINKKTGYGKYKIRGKHTGAHRIAYELAYGAIPENTSICHRCDVRLCCNPGHLFPGTQKDNMEDASRKGRVNRVVPWLATWQKSTPMALAKGITGKHGETSYGCKLKNRDVYQIRALAKRGVLTQFQIGKQFGIGQDEVSRIVNFKRWAHLK